MLDKYTIKSGFKALPISERFKAILALIRPFTICIAFLVGFIGGLAPVFYLKLSLAEYIPKLIYIGVTYAILNASSNCFNQAFDAEVDKVNKPYRPIPRGLVTVDEALTLALLGYIVGIARAFTISIMFGLLACLVSAITILYSLNPVRLKQRFFINSLSLAFARGYLPLLGCWYAFMNELPLIVHYFGIALFLFSIGANSIKDFPDIKGDRMFGIRTLPVVLGERKAMSILLGFAFSPFLIFSLVDELRLMLPLIVIPVAIGLFGMKKLSWSENTLGWVLFYLGLLAMYLAFSMMFLLSS